MTTPKHGGPRPNSGRKPRGATARVQVSVSLDRETLAEIDRQKGPEGRGAVIDRWAWRRCVASVTARSLIATMRDMDRWMANANHAKDHPWRISLSAAIAQAIAQAERDLHADLQP